MQLGNFISNLNGWLVSDQKFIDAEPICKTQLDSHTSRDLFLTNDSDGSVVDAKWGISKVYN